MLLAVLNGHYFNIPIMMESKYEQTWNFIKILRTSIYSTLYCLMKFKHKTVLNPVKNYRR